MSYIKTTNMPPRNDPHIIVKVCFEKRYSDDQPRDEHGRWTNGSGSGLTGGGDSGTIKPTLVIGMQFFGSKKYGIQLKGAEKQKVHSEINTAYNAYKDQPIFIFTTHIGDTRYNYKIVNRGFDDYIVLAKWKARD